MRSKEKDVLKISGSHIQGTHTVLLTLLLLYEVILKTELCRISRASQIRHKWGTRVTAAAQYTAFPVCRSSAIRSYLLSCGLLTTVLHIEQ